MLLLPRHTLLLLYQVVDEDQRVALLHVELDGVEVFSQEHRLGRAQLLFIGIVVIFQLQLAHVEVSEGPTIRRLLMQEWQLAVFVQLEVFLALGTLVL